MAGSRGQSWYELDKRTGDSHVEDSFEFVADQLVGADSRAAIVLRTSPTLLVAAYSDDIDCVAGLEFPKRVADEYGLAPGDRLITCNSYGRSPVGLMPDLLEGPNSSRRWTNFRPFIAQFVSSDMQRLQELMSSIREEEWNHAETLGREWLERCLAGDVGPRHGSPLRCEEPGLAEPASMPGRATAFAIDLVLLLVATATVRWFALEFDDMVQNYFRNPGPGPAQAAMTQAGGQILFTSLLAYLAYCPVLLASPLMGTLGKWMLGLKALPKHSSKRLGIGRAIYRTLLIVPGLFAAVIIARNGGMRTERHIELPYDRMARTLVIRRR